MAQLYFYYSAMNAGKSTALLQSSYNYQERGMRTVVYTAEIDDRFGAGKVSSRIGLSSPAKLFNQNSSLFDEIRAEHEQQAIHCVLVDECQFLTRQQVYELSEVVDQLDIPVLCYGLRTDFRGELFIGSQYLLAWSARISSNNDEFWLNNFAGDDKPIRELTFPAPKRSSISAVYTTVRMPRSW